MGEFDDPEEFLSIVSALLMILLNAHNILAMASMPIEARTLQEFHVDMEEGVRHMDNNHSNSIAALYLFQLWKTFFWLIMK